MPGSRPVASGIAFVGRSAELDTLCALVERAADGPGQVGLVEGEAGIGKSRLLAEALAHAEDRGFRVLRGSTDELERDRPFRALVEALGEPAGRGSLEPERGEPIRMLTAEPALAWQSTPLAQTPNLGFQLGFQAVEALLSLFEKLASAGPVVLALEDLHWADPSTLRAVRSIGTRLAHLPIALLATLRPAPRVPELDRVVEGLLARGGRHLCLQALDDGAVAALAGGWPPPRRAHGCCRSWRARAGTRSTSSS